jgi:hypothetical protein
VIGGQIPLGWTANVGVDLKLDTDKLKDAVQTLPQAIDEAKSVFKELIDKLVPTFPPKQ